MNKIIITTDIHGQYTNDNFANGEKTNYGLSVLAKKINEIRDENTILIDNGDFFQGSPLMTHYFKFHEYENPAITAINALDYNYYNFGNHDFNYGYKELTNFINRINAKVISTNVEIDGIKNTYQIHQFSNGQKIALIGITTDFVNIWEKSENLEKIIIKDSYQILQEQIKMIKEQELVDKIIVIYHGGIEKDLETGTIVTSTSGENQGFKFCENFDIDILITGHEHREFVGIINQTIVTQSKNRGQSAICITLNDDGSTVAEIIKAEECLGYDEQFNNLFNEDIKIVNGWLDSKIAEIEGGDLLIKDPYEARIHKHPIFDLIATIMHSNCDVDFTSCALPVDAKGFNHRITVRDVLATFPFENTLCIFSVTKGQIKRYLETAASFFVNIDGNVAIKKDKLEPKNEIYNYEVVSGLDYVINSKAQENHKVEKMYFKEEKAEYLIAMSNYRASGVGGYDVVKEMKFIKEIPEDWTNMIINYLLEHEKIGKLEKNCIKIL